MKHPQKSMALIAFSPGEYLGGSTTVQNTAAQLSIPIFVTSAKDQGEIENARAIVAAAGSTSKVQFVPHSAGIHGSSTLRADRNPKGSAENWAVVKEFLAGFVVTISSFGLPWRHVRRRMSPRSRMRWRRRERQDP
jgi:hypothetical protein